MKIDYKNLFVICANAEISIKEAFAKAEVSKTTMCNIKSGHNVQAITAGKLAKALGVSVEQLLAD